MKVLHRETMKEVATAIIAEDENIRVRNWKSALAMLWPELQIVGEAADGISAAKLLKSASPTLFSDVRMPGLSES